MVIFKRATKTQARLRMALTGISNSGKTWTALTIATGLGGPIALIDTERGSASKYAEYFAFDVLELENFHPDTYVQAIEAAGANGYAVCIVDSLTHAWAGEGGALDLHNELAKQGSANSYMAWRDITPLQNKLIEAVLRSPCHVITTLRSKAEYVLERDRNGKNVPRKIGLAPIQRQGLEYEFDLFGVLDDEHVLTITKSRFPRLRGSIKMPGREFGTMLAQELSGNPDAPKQGIAGAQAADDLYGEGAGDRLRQPTPQQYSATASNNSEVIQRYQALYRQHKALPDYILDSVPRQLWNATWQGIRQVDPSQLAADYELARCLLTAGADCANNEDWVQTQARIRAEHDMPAAVDTQSTNWRAEAQEASKHLPETQETVPLWQTIAAAMNDPATSDTDGKALLAAIREQVAAMGSKG